jgi:4-hydroxy-tetrahydrodipicolinate reductase
VPECQAVIDVTSPEGLSALLPRLSGQALLIGTTGDLPMEALQAYAETAPVAIVPNFSAGVPLLIELLREAIARMPDDWRVEITEAHHDQKKDAPSGTARRLARVVVEAGAGNPPMHSIRAGDTIGEHTVWLAGPGERIELTHVATRREVFAIGALRWANWLVEQPPELYRP